MEESPQDTAFTLHRTGSQRLAQESPPYYPRSTLLGRDVKGAWSYSNLGMVELARQGVPDPHLLVHSKETTKASKGGICNPSLGKAEARGSEKYFQQEKI